MQPDAERVCVAWAKANGPLVALNGDRVATRLPSSEWSTFLRVTLIDGSLVLTETGDVAAAAVQWDAYARSSSRAPDYATASAIARTLLEEALEASTEIFEAEGELVGFGNFSGPRRIEEEDTGFARFTIDTLVVVRA